MFQSRKRPSSGLLEWSMFDHDESPDDICEFDDLDEAPDRSQRSNIEPSPSSSCVIDNSCSNQDVAMTTHELSQDIIPSTSQEIQTGGPSCSTNASGTRINESWSSVFDSTSFVASASFATTRKKRRTRNMDFSACEIDDASNDEFSSSPTRDGIRRRRSLTIDETTDEELGCSPNRSPEQRRTTAHAQCQPIPMAGSPNRRASRIPDPPACPLRESVLKNGFQESLIMAVQKMNSELTLWNCYKSNASFPKKFASGSPAPFTVRIVFTEALYGSTYCTCHLVDPEVGNNITDTPSLMFSSEVSESEEFAKGTVLRIYPPWKEHAVESQPNKILTAIQFYEVLDKGDAKAM